MQLLHFYTACVFFTFLLHCVTFQFTIVTMTDKTLTEDAGATGGQQDLPPPQEDADFEDLRRRIQKLGKKDRRSTLQRLSLMYVEDDSGELSKKNPSLSRDQDFSGVPQLATSNLSNITVEQADKKLPRFSGSDKLSQGEVSYRRWQRAATRLVEENIPESQKKKSITKIIAGQGR